jgi:hypothetical protein
MFIEDRLEVSHSVGVKCHRVSVKDYRSPLEATNTHLL